MPNPEFIKWIDSHSPSASIWVDKNEIDHGLLVIKTVGYVIHECKKSITVASQVAQDGSNQVSGVISIPKCCIKKRKTLK